ncbi:MAG: hypothetical protein H7308_01575 [Chthonomonadaceae bacterium]|nr:hypothetical protein [Chthonomonadaceae bacterium]
MEPFHAAHILGSLANGIDPYTGEVLPEERKDQHLMTADALFFAVKSLEVSLTSQLAEITPKEKRPAPLMAGKSWDATQNDLLKAQFERGVSVAEMMQLHERTRGSITSRLVRLGLLLERNAADDAVKGRSTTPNSHVPEPLKPRLVIAHPPPPPREEDPFAPN